MYVQAVGRAGRDGGNASALLLVRKELFSTFLIC